MNFPLSLPILAGLGITAMAGVYIMNKNDDAEEEGTGDVKQKKNKKKKDDSDSEESDDDEEEYDDRGFGFSFFGNPSASSTGDDNEAVGAVKKRKYNRKVPLQKTNRARKSYTTTKKNR